MQYKIESRPAFTIAGYRERMLTEEAFDRAPQIWRSVYTDGRIQKLHALLMQNGYRPEGILGVAVGGQWGENESVDYYLAVTTSVGSPQTSKADIPADMLELSLPAATWAIIEANGDPFEVIQPVYKWFYTQWLPASGYVLDDLPVIESYRQDNRHTLWFAVKKP